MKTLSCAAICTVLALTACGEQKKPATTETAAPPTTVANVRNLQTEVACGKCVYGMAGVQGCETAVKINGVPLLVRGSSINAHDSGLCGSSKTAVVSGEVEDGVFVASSIALE